MNGEEPLAGVGSIRARLAILVGCSVVVAALVGALGTEVGVPSWLGIPATIAVALGVTWWLATGMTTPLRRMTEAAGRMADGDYEVRVPTTGSDEIATLARAFDRMARDLGAADDHRRRLVATVAHELRTPLAAQQALLENLVDGVVAPDDTALQQALHQSERLGRLVSDLLDLSREDGRGTPLRPQRVTVRELVDRAVGEAELQGRSVTLVTDVSPEDLTVTGDRGRLEQVLANLVDNALRHSPAGGTVTVSAVPAPRDRWSLTVTDEGPGLDPGDAERRFSRFGSGGDGGGGTGLGLAIAGWVATLHGGTIEALHPGTDGDDAAGGARIRMTLPVDPLIPERSGALTRTTTTPSTTTPPLSPARTTQETPMTPQTTQPSSVAVDVPERPRTWTERWWPERDARPQTRALATALGVGLLAALLLPQAVQGLGLLLVLVAGGLSLWAFSPRRARPLSFVTAAVAVPLALTTILRADVGYAFLAVLVAVVLAALACTGARSLTGIATSLLAWPAAALRGLPLLDRTLRAVARGGQLWSTLRTVAVSLVLLLVFGGLLASSDAVFGSWADAVVPDVGDDLFFRIFVLVFFAGVTLAGLYLAVNPPATEDLHLSDHVPFRVPPREWQVPLAIVVGVFVLWLLAQTASLVGGRDYVLRTTGVTYAEYARQGFGQLLVVTVLTIGLVRLVGSFGRVDSPRDARVRTVMSALLCGLALLVVGSALRRMALYQDAYGWTVTRVFADLVEFWLGVVLVALLVSLLRDGRRWLGRLVVLSGALAVAVFTVGNTPAFVAERNIARYERGAPVDVAHLRALGPDAAPAIDASSLDPTLKACVLAGRSYSPDDGVLSWSLGRQRAAEVYGRYPEEPVGCPLETSSVR